MGRIWDEEGPMSAERFDEKTTTISTPIIALPAVLIFTQEMVSLVDVSIGTAMMSVGR